MQNELTPLEIDFLRESNLIEGEGEDAMHDSELAWLYIKPLDKLTEHDLLHAHFLLMNTRNIQLDDRGVWTKYQTRIGGRNNPDPWKVPALMAAWIDDINDSLKSTTPWGSSTNERAAKNFHVRFEHIHPFCDGNGRMGRILMNWHRLKIGLPVLVIENRKKRHYYRWF